ncbi:IstB-like ATP binding protein [Vibrio phage 1.052.A._10N.286.46.C3]|nr:IstB-like ATP binding protein [Vibrio phage 1.052.A._10N.286.46.C3]
MSSIMRRIRERADTETPVDELIAQIRARREQDEKNQASIFEKQFKDAEINRTVGRSGILPLHMNCTVRNFEADTPGKINAKQFTRDYVINFESNNGQGFIFSGNPGTGKNHLAAAMCNELMSRGKSCLIITVNELMQKLRACYQQGTETSEDKFFKTMIDFDLLILDEIGLQRNNDNERLALNQIVDQRVCRMKPTGMLTNLPAGSDDDSEMTMNSLLGVRIMDRMRMNGGKWISFDWESFRK